jgi:hypothetical protein
MARTRKDAVVDSTEEEAMERDKAKQEKAPGTPVVPRLARRHIHAVHPDHGEPVTFNPAELRPDWVEVSDGADLR